MHVAMILLHVLFTGGHVRIHAQTALAYRIVSELGFTGESMTFSFSLTETIFFFYLPIYQFLRNVLFCIHVGFENLHTFFEQSFNLND